MNDNNIKIEYSDNYAILNQECCFNYEHISVCDHFGIDFSETKKFTKEALLEIIDNLNKVPYFPSQHGTRAYGSNLEFRNICRDNNYNYNFYTNNGLDLSSEILYFN